jgi:adenosylcobinamide kinase / adenosylcobinamide-phosphate guanylyltransferase
MPGGFTFVVGGARSGKSGFALKLAGELSGPCAYIATARALDPEMEERIERHKKDRGPGWETFEVPVDITERIIALKGYGVIILDCLTLWLMNLVEAGLDDDEIKRLADRLAFECNNTGSSVIAVSNELGLGIVPENHLARRFRDLSGSMNQIMANAATEVFFVAAGIPLKMK